MALTIATYLWLISLPFLLYFIRLGKSKPLNSEERLLAWIGVLLFVLSVSFQVIEWLGITPAYLLPYTSNIVYILGFVGAIAIALLVGRRTKKVPSPSSQPQTASAPILSARNVQTKRTFENQEILLDGFNWIDCIFRNCNFIVERGDFELRGNEIHDCKLTARGNAETVVRLARLFFPQIPIVEPAISSKATDAMPVSLKVEALVPRQYPKEILPADQREKVLEVYVQRFLVKATNGAIRKLKAKVSFSGRTPAYFRWGLPQVRIDGKEPEPSFDQIILADLDEVINLVPEEERELPVYVFIKSDEGNFLQLNTVGHRIIKLSEIESVPIAVDIQFIAENYTDSKARPFILHTESLDKLGLKERG